VKPDLEFGLIRNEVFSYLDAGSTVNPSVKQQILKKEASLNGRFSLDVHRQTLLADFLDNLREAPPPIFQGQATIKFLGELATDTGGPSREFVDLLSHELFTDASVFDLVNQNQYYWFKPQGDLSPEQRRTLWSAGVLLRLALSNGITISIPLPAAVFKSLTDEQFTVADLAEVDPELAESLAQWRQDYVVEGADYGLVFAVPGVLDGREVSRPLCEGGAQRSVTAENFDEYIQAIVNDRLRGAVETSRDAFRQGFRWVGDTKVMEYLYARDFETLLSGTEVQNWAEFKNAAAYVACGPNSPAVVLFWSIFDGWSHADKCRFLQFATGSARAPVGGLRTMRFMIEATEDRRQIPTARTCTGQFMLPDVRDEANLRRRLEICLSNCVGFGFS
jgi:hypothetical protein